LDFHVTSGIDYGPLAAGATAPTSNGLLLTVIDQQALSIYSQLGDRGTNYLAAHELAHHTQVAKEHYASLWQTYLDRGGEPSASSFQLSPEFRANEAFVNGITSSILNCLAIPNLVEPPLGY
jgi:hypothetical protein